MNCDLFVVVRQGKEKLAFLRETSCGKFAKVQLQFNCFSLSFASVLEGLCAVKQS